MILTGLSDLSNLEAACVARGLDDQVTVLVMQLGRHSPEWARLQADRGGWSHSLDMHLALLNGAGIIDDENR